MAVVNIAEGVRIASDENQWMVQKLRAGKDRKTGEPTLEWRAISYHASIGQAARSWAESELRRSDAEGIEAIEREFRRIQEQLDAALHFRAVA